MSDEWKRWGTIYLTPLERDPNPKMYVSSELNKPVLSDREWIALEKVGHGNFVGDYCDIVADALRRIVGERPKPEKLKTAAELAAEYMSLVLDSKTFPAGSEEDEEQSNKRGQLEKQWLQAREAEKAVRK